MFVHIGILFIGQVELEPSAKPTTYVVAFSPYTNTGGAFKWLTLYGQEPLCQFLTEINIRSEVTPAILKELQEKRILTIENIELNERQLQRYGLGVEASH